MKLPDSELRKVISLIQEGKELPLKYQRLLFPEQEEPKGYELTYAGKAREEDIIADTIAAPLQEVRTFNSDNKFDDGWSNKLIFGNDLVYRKNIGWVAQPDFSYDSSAKRGNAKFVDHLKNVYRVLMSRAHRGCYVYFMDDETRKYFESNSKV